MLITFVAVCFGISLIFLFTFLAAAFYCAKNPIVDPSEELDEHDPAFAAYDVPVVTQSLSNITDVEFQAVTLKPRKKAVVVEPARYADMEDVSPELIAAKYARQKFEQEQRRKRDLQDYRIEILNR